MKKIRLNIGARITAGFALAALLLMALALYSVSVSQRSLLESVGKSSVFLAEEMLRRMDMDIYHKIESLQAYADDLALEKTLLESNREFEKLDSIEAYVSQTDREWVSAPKDEITPFMQALIGNELSNSLRREFIEFYERRYGYRVFGEVFVTNEYGANAAQTGKTTDYYQADEEWWQVAKTEGLYVGDVEYDESAGVYAVIIGVRIADEQGNFIGAMKGVVVVDAIIRQAEIATKKYETTQIRLTTREGRLIFASAPFQFGEDVSVQEFFQEIQSASGFFLAEEGGREKLFSYARSRGYRNFAGFQWILVMGCDVEEISQPISALRNSILAAFLVLFTTGIISAALISRSISNPIGKLIETVDEIRAGRLDVEIGPGLREARDEVGDLARAFDQMAKRVKERTVELTQAGETLRYRLELERLVSTISTNFIKLSPTEMDRAVNDALRAIGTFAGVDRSYVFQFSNNNVTVANTHEWCAEGIEPQIGNLQELPVEIVPWWMEKLNRFETIHIPRVADLPIEASAEKEMLQAQDIQSVVVVPLTYGKSLVGFMGFDSVRVEKAWAEEDIALLKIVGEIIVNAFERKRAEDEVRRLKEFNEGIVKSMVEGIAVEDAQGYFAFVNPAAAALLGYTPEELLGQHWAITVPPDQQSIIQAADERRVRGQADRYEVELIRKDGTRISVLIAGGPRFDAETGRFAGTLAVFTDITERKQREREMEALAEIGRAISSTLDLAQVLETIAMHARRLFEADGSRIHLIEPDGETLRCAVALQEHAEQVMALPLKLGQGFAGLVASKGAPEIVNRTLEDTRGIQVPGTPEEPEALAMAPLKWGENVIGVMTVGRLGEDRPFAPGDLRLLTAFADQATQAIANARLYEDARRRLAHVETLREIDRAIAGSMDLRLVLKVIVKRATVQLGVDAADVLLLTPGLQTLEFAAGRGFRTSALRHTHLHLGESYAGQAALERRIVHIPDLSVDADAFRRSPYLPDEGFVTYFAAPLVAKGRIVGVLEIFHRTRLDPGVEWQNFLEALASQTAIAIDNTQLFDSLQRANTDLMLAYDATIEGWSHALDLRDKETEGHTRRVAEMTVRLTQSFGMSDAEQVHVRRGALLHDIGKMGVPDTILLKPGPLSDKEWAVMHKHPAHAYEMLSPIAYLRPAVDIPYCHHEKWDGSGYPRGLKAEQIPLAARIFAVVDVWDALISERPYRPAWTKEKALEYIREQSGKHFDPQVVEAFMKLVGERD